MDRKSLARRLGALIVAAVVVMGIFILRLVQFQLVQGEELLEKAQQVSNYLFSIPAARGEIVDEYGRAMASNVSGYNLVINKLMLTGDLNETLVELVEILQAGGDEWNDTMPISAPENGHYEFTADEDDSRAQSRLADLKNNLVKQPYATADQVMAAVVERYDLQDYDPEWQRILGGIRYQMELEEFSDNNNFTLAEDVSSRTVATVKERGLTSEGADITETSYRVYADGTLAPHLLGYVGPIYAEDWKVTDEDGNVSYPLKEKGYAMNDTIGQAGLEQVGEDKLRGEDGLKQVTRDKNGVIISTEVIQDPEPGLTMVTTTNADLQKKVYEALENQILNLQATAKQYKGQEACAGAVVVIDVKTGGVLACVNYPSYDLNLRSTNAAQYASDPNTPLVDRALRGLYSPGSTFKPVVALEGLLSGLITPTDTPVRCGGAQASYNYYVTSGGPRCEGIGHVGGGSLNVYDALGYSCNTYFYDLGRREGAENFNEMARTLGLATETGVELSEYTGRTTDPDDDNFTLGLELMAAIGQGNTAVTPVQLATYAATIANDGTRYRTHFISSYRDSNTGEVVESFEPEVVAQVEDNVGAFDAVEEGMIRAAKNSSALRDYPMTIAVKTGSPQRAEYYDREKGLTYLNSAVIAYGPVEDPQIAIGAIIEYGGGGSNLLPVVRDIFNAYFIEKTGDLQSAEAGQLLP